MQFDFTVTAGAVANLIGILGILVTIVLAAKKLARETEARHQENTRKADERHQQNQDRFGELENRLETVWGWFERNVINGHGRQSE